MKWLPLWRTPDFFCCQGGRASQPRFIWDTLSQNVRSHIPQNGLKVTATCLLNLLHKSCLLNKPCRKKKNSHLYEACFVYLSLCLCIYLFIIPCSPATRPGGGEGTTGARVNPMDIRNLSFIRRWRQARPKYGTVNTNHRSFTDTDTHRQLRTQINTARTHTHIHKICLWRQMLLRVHGAGHGSRHGALQISFSVRLFIPLYLCLSFGTLVSLLPLSLLLADLWQE